MDTIKDVLKECSPYVNLLQQGQPGCFLIRAVPNNIDIELYQHSNHKRTPLNMDDAMHDAVNKHFGSLFNWNVRNGVFCFGVTDPERTLNGIGYGRNHLLFPCGEFSYVCDENIFDLYEHQRDFFLIDPKAEISEFIASINYTNKNLNSAMSQQSHHNRSTEIMINCEQYYLVSLDYVNTLTSLIWPTQSI